MADTPTTPMPVPAAPWWVSWTCALFGMLAGYGVLLVLGEHIDRKYQRPFLQATTFIPTPPQEPARLSVWVLGQCIYRDEDLDRQALRWQARMWNRGLHFGVLVFYIVPLAWGFRCVGRRIWRWSVQHHVASPELRADYDDQPLQSPQDTAS